jgi:hypothetical protein
MVCKEDEQGCLPGCRARTVENIVQKSVLYVPIPAGLYASDRDERVHFQSHSLSS